MKAAGTTYRHERCVGAASVVKNQLGQVSDARLPQEGRNTPRQRFDSERNPGNFSGGHWRIDEADCTSPSEGPSSRYFSLPCILKGTVLYCYVFGNYFFSAFLVYNYKAEDSALLLLCKRMGYLVQKR